MNVVSALLEQYFTEIHSPLFPYHLGLGFIVLGILSSIVWSVARAAEKRNFTDMLTRLSTMTMRLKDAEHIGHYGSFSWTSDHTKSYWSEEMFNLFDMVPGQVPPTLDKVISMIVPEDRDKAAAALAHAKSTAGPFDASFRFRTAGNSMRYLRLEGKTTMGRDHLMQSMEGVARDVTRETEVERAKTEFVSLASHQLKTPLTAISWLTEALLSGDKGALNDEQRKYIENIHVTDRHMVDMVNDLLNISRIELGTLQIKSEDIDVTALAQGVVEEQRKAADDKKVVLTLTFEDGLPHITADRNLARMIFQNLISNAIKYTPAGGKVSLQVSRGTGMRDSLYIVVSDTGIGIPKAEQHKVFEKLHRATNAQNLVPDGTGLGLYVIKTIIERVRGVITFDSIEDKGTTFYVTLPIVWEDSQKK